MLFPPVFLAVRIRDHLTNLVPKRRSLFLVTFPRDLLDLSPNFPRCWPLLAASSRSVATLIAQLLSSILLLFLTSLSSLEYSDLLAFKFGSLRYSRCTGKFGRSAKLAIFELP